MTEIYVFLRVNSEGTMLSTSLSSPSLAGSTLVQYGSVDSQFYLPVSDLQNLSAYHLPAGARNQPNNPLPGAVVNNLIDSNRMGEVRRYNLQIGGVCQARKIQYGTRRGEGILSVRCAHHHRYTT